MENVFLVITVARQIEGEYVFIKTEKAFHQNSKAEDLVKKLKSDYITVDGKPKVIRLSTNNGNADCICEVGVFQMEIED